MNKGFFVFSEFSKGNFLKDLLMGMFFVVFLIAFVGGGTYFATGSWSKIDPVLICGDNTVYNGCSLNKPYFCENGILIEKASSCGCVENTTKSNEKCILEEFSESKIISLDYWLRGQRGEIDLIVYGGVLEYMSSLPYSLQYQEKEIPLRKDFKLNKIDNEIQRQALIPLIVEIQNIAPNSKEDQARIAISLVQNLDYKESEEVLVLNLNNKIGVSKFPYQIIEEGVASCEGKSEVLLFLLREIEYGTALFYYGEENHEAVGIKCALEHSLDSSGFCFIETTTPSILTDNQGKYLGAGKLSSEPQVILISEGLSLSETIYEYKDARKFIKVREKRKFNLFNKYRFKNLKLKYGLVESF